MAEEEDKDFEMEECSLFAPPAMVAPQTAGYDFDVMVIGKPTDVITEGADREASPVRRSVKQ